MPSPVAGTLMEIIADEGATVEVGALLARVEEGGAPAVAALTVAADSGASGALFVDVRASLYCGSADGCKPVSSDFVVGAEQTEKFAMASIELRVKAPLFEPVPETMIDPPSSKASTAAPVA